MSEKSDFSPALWQAVLASRSTSAPLPPETPGWASALLGEPEITLGQLGQSLDGRIATETGHSHYINGRPALAHLHRLRALCDGVLVGAGTVLADDPRLTVRLVSGPHPVRIILDPSGRVPDTAAVWADDGVRRICLQATDRARPAGVEVIRCERRADASLDPHAIRQALHQHGIGRLLIEGGAMTLSNFMQAGALNRVHMLIAPVLMGSGRPGLLLPAITHMDQALRPATTPYFLGEGEVLFDCAL